MTPLTVSIVDQVNEAERLWNLFSPHESLYDQWDVRYCFFRHQTDARPHFITAFEGNDPVALLPLQWNATENALESMGGYFMEDNRVFLKPGFESAAPLLFERISSKASIRSMIAESGSPVAQLPEDYPTYVYPLEGIASLDDFLVRTFSPKTRSKFRNKMRHIEALAPTFRLNHLEDLDLLAQFNLDTFGSESLFRTIPSLLAVFKDLCGLGYPFFIHSIMIDGKIHAVSFSMQYQKTYLYLLPGTLKEDVRNLGHYLTLQNFRTALEQGCTLVDAGRGENNWKDQWNLTPKTRHRFDVEGTQDALAQDKALP